MTSVTEIGVPQISRCVAENACTCDARGESDEIWGERAGEAGDAQQCERRNDRDELLAELAPGVRSDDVRRMTVYGSAERFLEGPDPDREQ